MMYTIMIIVMAPVGAALSAVLAFARHRARMSGRADGEAVIRALFTDWTEQADALTEQHLRNAPSGEEWMAQLREQHYREAASLRRSGEAPDYVRVHGPWTTAAIVSGVAGMAGTAITAMAGTIGQEGGMAFMTALWVVCMVLYLLSLYMDRRDEHRHSASQHRHSR